MDINIQGILMEMDIQIKFRGKYIIKFANQ